MWVLFSELVDQTARLVSLNLQDGRQKCVARASAGIPIIVAYEASVRRLAYIHDANGDAQAVWCVLPSLAPREFGGGWEGRPVRVALSRCGTRAALETILPTGFNAVYVFSLPDEPGPAELIAGVVLPDGSNLKRPAFFGGPDRVFCYTHGRSGAVGGAMIDLSHVGDASHRAPGARRGAHIGLWTPPISIVVDGPRLARPDRSAVLVTGIGSDGHGQQLYLLTSDGSTAEPVGPSHAQVNAIADVVADGQVVYGADARVWQTDGEGSHALARLSDMLRINGLVRDVPGGRYIYGYNRGLGINITATSGGNSKVLGWRIEGHKLMSLVGLVYSQSDLPFDELEALDPAVPYMPSRQVGGHDNTEPLPSDRALLAPTGQLSPSLSDGVRIELDQTVASGEVSDDPMFPSQGDLTDTEAIGHDAFTTLQSTGQLPTADAPSSRIEPIGSATELTGGLGATRPLGSIGSTVIPPDEPSTQGDDLSETQVLDSVQEDVADPSHHDGSPEPLTTSGEELQMSESHVEPYGEAKHAQGPDDEPKNVAADAQDQQVGTPKMVAEPTHALDDLEKEHVEGSMGDEPDQKHRPAELAAPSTPVAPRPADDPIAGSMTGEAGGGQSVASVGDEDNGYGDDSEDVWTSAPAAIAAPLTEPEPVRDVVSSARQRMPRKVAESDAPSAQIKTTTPDGPRADVDFDGWFEVTLRLEDPVPQLQSLERFRGDAAVGIAVSERLHQQIARLQDDPETLSDLIFIMAAAAHVRAQPARERLLQFCREAYDRLSRGGSLPEVEEHFAMAAIRALDNPAGRFSTMAVYREYEGVVTAMSDALEKGGEESAARRLRNLGRRYRRALEQLVYPDRVRPRSEKRKPDAPRVSPSDEAQPVNTKIDLMDGYEFPALDDPVQEAGNFVDKFQPFMSVFPSAHGAPVADRPSVDAFRVTAFDEPADDDTEWVPPAKSNGLGIFLGLAAIAGGLALAILGYRLTGFHALVGVLWTLGGVALVSDRSMGVTLGGLSYGLTSIVLLYTGFVMDVPAWLLPDGVAAGGILTLVVTVFILTRLRPSQVNPLVDPSQHF